MCQVKIADTAAATQFKAITASVTDVDPLVNGSSQATWENDANNNTAWQLRVEYATSTVPPVNVDTPNEIRVRVYDMAGGAGGIQIGSEWVISGIDPTSLSGVFLRDNFCFDLDPLDGLFNDTATDRKFGLLAIEIQCIRSGATPATRDYDTNSPTGGTPPSGATVSWGRGYFRQRMQMLVTTKASNVSFGGATPSTWAYPDPLYLRHVFNRTRYSGATTGSFATRLRLAPLGGLGTIVRSATPINFSDTLTNIDQLFDAPSGINEDFNAGAASSVAEWEIEFNVNTFGNDNQFALRSTSVPSPFSFISERMYRRSGFGGNNVTPALTPVSATRTSANDIVNFGLHTVAATVKLQNARSEFITSAHTLAVQQFNFKSYDITAGAEQSTLASSVSPDASGIYTIPAIAYTGPTSTSSRGTGPNGDTANHNVTGRDKGIRAVHPTVVQKSSASARLWALSDLLRLDVHPQDQAGLVKDTDPLAVPGDAEDSQFEIGDELYLFAYVSDVNAVGLSGVQLKVVALKPTGAAHLPEVDRTSAIAPDLGWVTTSYDVTDITPMGEHYGRVRVDVNFTGASGNYGFADVVSDPALDAIGGLRQTLTVIPAPVFDAVANALHGIISFR